MRTGRAQKPQRVCAQRRVAHASSGVRHEVSSTAAERAGPRSRGARQTVQDARGARKQRHDCIPGKDARLTVTLDVNRILLLPAMIACLSCRLSATCAGPAGACARLRALLCGASASTSAAAHAAASIAPNFSALLYMPVRRPAAALRRSARLAQRLQARSHARTHAHLQPAGHFQRHLSCMLLVRSCSVGVPSRGRLCA